MEVHGDFSDENSSEDEMFDNVTFDQTIFKSNFICCCRYVGWLVACRAQHLDAVRLLLVFLQFM